MLKTALAARTNTMGLKGPALRWTITAIAVTGFSLFGYDQGVMSGIITGVKFNQEFPPTSGTDHHATVVQGAVTSCYELGCFFGAIFTLLRGEKIGRRPIILVGAVLMIIGTVITVSAFGQHWGLGQFVIGRVISGLGNGMNTATIPVWQSEMSKAANRGFLVNLEGSVIALGTFIAYWLDFGFSYINSSVQWRFPIAFQSIFAIILIVGMLGLPESPRWLIAQGRMEEAKHILHALEGDGANKEEIEVEARVIRDAINRSAQETSLRELFTGGKTQHFRRMVIGASTQFFQQFTGCNAAIYYSTVLFETSLGLSRRLSLVLGGVFATVYVLATIPSFFLIERAGRRNLFFFGAIGQGCAFLITFACLAAPETKGNAKGAAVGLYLFICCFATSILQLPWIYPPEVNPLRTRTIAVAVSTCTNWITNFAVVMFTPIFIGSTRWGAYLFFALMNFSWVPIIYFFYPETAGRSLEEIDIIFAKAHIERKPAHRIAKYMPKMSAAEVEAEAERIGLYEPKLDSERSSLPGPTPETSETPETDSDNASAQQKA